MDETNMDGVREATIDLIIKRLENLSLQELFRLIGGMDQDGLWRD